MDKYKELRDLVVWAVTHYGIVNTDGIIERLRDAVIRLDAVGQQSLSSSDEHIHKAFKKEGVFVTSPINYIVYESGFKAGIEYAQKTAHNSDNEKCKE